MKLSISTAIINKYPDLRIGVVVAQGVNNSQKVREVFDLLRQSEKDLAGKDLRHVAEWQEMHKSFGNNPRRYAPSVAAIVKRVLKGGTIPSINTLVDLYNFISLKYIVPVGGEDLDQCQGDIWLDFATGTEEFLEIGATQASPPVLGEIVYKDDRGVLCRKFNWREADRTKLTENTKNAVLVVEALASISDEMLDKALLEIAGLITRYCGGQTRIDILSSHKTEIDL